MEGWIKVHRKMLDNPLVFKDSDYAVVWIYLLLNATHTEYPVIFNGKKIILLPGQLITGRKVISEKLKVSESKVQRILKWFESDLQIEQQTSNKNRLITIVNWEQYQNIEQQNEREAVGKQTANEHKQECKNVKNEINNIYSVHFDEFWKVYPRKKEKAKAYKAYCARLKDGFSDDELLKAATVYAEECKKRNTEERYIKLGSTFLSANTPFEDYLKEGEKNEQDSVQQKEEVSEKYGTWGRCTLDL